MILNLTCTLLFLQLWTNDAFQPYSSTKLSTSQKGPVARTVSFNLKSSVDPSNTENIESSTSTSTSTSSINALRSESNAFQLDDLEKQALSLKTLMGKDGVDTNTIVNAGKVLGPANVLVYDTSLRGMLSFTISFSFFPLPSSF